MGIWQRIKSRVKEWLGGGSPKKATPPRARAIRSVSRGSNQSAGYYRGGRTVSSREEEERKKKKKEQYTNAFKAKKSETKDVTEAFKKPSTNGLKGEALGKKMANDYKSAYEQKTGKKSVVERKQAIDTNRANAQKKLDDLKAKREGKVQKERTYTNADGEKVVVRETKSHRAQGKVGGTLASDTAYRMKEMPKTQSFSRGLASGLSLGATELEAKRLAKNDKDRAKAEKTYQTKKSKGAEMAGEIAGSLVSFGATEGATRAIGEKAVSKVAPKAATKLAERKFIQKSAKRAVDKAVKKGVAKEASEELIKQVGRDKAKKIINTLGSETAQNLTTGAIYDINKASAEHKVGSKDWWKELGTSAAFNVGVTSAIGGASVIGGGKSLVKESMDKISDRAAAKYLLNPDSKKNAVKEVEGLRSKSARLPRERKPLPKTGYVDVEKERAALKKTAEDLIAKAERIEAHAKSQKQIQEAASLRYRAKNIERSLEGKVAAEPPKKTSRSIKYGSQDDDWVTTIKKAADEGLSPEERAGLVKPKPDAKSKGEVFNSDKNGWAWGKTEDGRLYVGDDYDKAFFDDTPENRERVAELWENRAVSKGKTKKATPPKEDVAVEAQATETPKAVDTEISSTTDATVAEEKPKPPRRPTKTEKARDELRAERQALQEEYEAAQKAGEDTTGILADMQEADMTLKDLDRQIAKADKARATREANRARLTAKDEAENVSEEITDNVVKNTPSEAEITDNAVKNTTTETTPSEAGASSTGRQKKTKEPRVINRPEDMVGRSRERTPMRERIKDFTQSIRTKVADSLSAFEDEARKKPKAEMERDYGAINALRSYKTRANRSVTNQQLKWDGSVYENGKSIAEIFSGMTEEEEKAFNAYLLLKHAPDRLREDKSIFKNIELADGRSLDDVATINEEIERIMREHPNVNFEERAKDVYQYTRNELQNRVDAGLLPQSVADEFNKKYPFYVPTGREGYFNGVHGDYSSVTGADGLHAAKGSDYDIWDIKQQLSDATTRNWRDMSMNNLFRRMFGDRVANDLAGEVDGGLEKVLDNTINLSKSRERDKYYANIFIDGKEHRVELEKRFYDAIQDMYKNGRLGNGIDVVNDAFAEVASVWKNLITEWSPIFMVKNFMRDFPEAIINTRQTKEFMESMRPALVELKDGGTYYQSLLDSGISMSTFMDIDKALAKDKRGIMGVLAKGNELTEMYPRLVEYMATFKKAGVDLNNAESIKAFEEAGGSLRELRDMAAANAADVTVNFGRSGSFGKMLNRGFVPFFNPSVQGWSKFVRNVTELEGAKDTLAFFAKATALGAAPLTLSNFLYKDNPNYQMISARDKANNYIIAIPPTSKDTNMFIKIPRSRFASVYGLPLVNAFNDNKMGFAEAIKIANDQVAPIDPLESTLFSPFLAARDNKTWYGTPIVSGALEDLPKSEQYDANTSLIAKGLGKATQNLPNELQISPKKADYILDAETGVIGDFVLPALTPSRQGGGNALNKYVAAPMGNVLKRQFSIDSVTQNDLSTRFYNELDKANTANKSARGGKAEKDEYTRLNAYSTEVSGITQAIKYMQGSKDDTKQEKIYGLQKVKNQLIQDALDGKEAPTSGQKVNAVQKYVGTTYAITNFGSSADKEAMKVYGAAKYGNMTDSAMQKRIDADKAFYKGVQSIGKLEGKLEKAGVKGSTTLSRAVALASVGADDELFGAYQATKKSRTESATKMERARNYFDNGGSEDEFVKLETARKTLGKLKNFDKEAELDNALKQLKSGEISESEYYQKQGEINYNANISYVGLATSLAQANAPARGYELYDIKAKNVQKGINLAAMGYTARDYREMAKAVDSDGNGYPSRKEIIAYVENSGIEDKATLFDALYYYQGSNPFGTPTNYSRDVAAAVGKRNGVSPISGETGDLKLKPDDTKSSRSGYGGYRRRYGRRYGGYSRSGGSTKVKAVKKSAFKAKSYKSSYKDITSSLKTRSSSSKSTTPTVKIEPPKVKFKKYEV